MNGWYQITKKIEWNMRHCSTSEERRWLWVRNRIAVLTLSWLQRRPVATFHDCRWSNPEYHSPANRTEHKREKISTTFVKEWMIANESAKSKRRLNDENKIISPECARNKKNWKCLNESATHLFKLHNWANLNQTREFVANRSLTQSGKVVHQNANVSIQL